MNKDQETMCRHTPLLPRQRTRLSICYQVLPPSIVISWRILRICSQDSECLW